MKKKIYNLYYNEETKKVDVKESVVNDEFDFSTSITNFQDGVLISHYITRENAESQAHGYNADITSEKLVLKKCKDCNTYFVLSDKEVQWYSDSGLVVPKRCDRCRIKRKKMNKEGNK